jgi:copper resistance protein B
MTARWFAAAILAVPMAAHAQDAMPGMDMFVPTYAAMRIDLAEYRFSRAGDSLQWEGEGWIGDQDRLLVRSRGEGETGTGLDDVEIEAAWSHAIDPWWNIQAGLRQDIRPVPARTHAMVGIEGEAPYRVAVLAEAYLSDRGQASGRLELTADERLTRRLVLQPRTEIDVAAQSAPAARLGAGLTNAELGLRLRYEITRKLAPYVGVAWTWAGAQTAAWRRAGGEAPSTRSIVAGIRTWF